MISPLLCYFSHSTFWSFIVFVKVFIFFVWVSGKSVNKRNHLLQSYLMHLNNQKSKVKDGCTIAARCWQPHSDRRAGAAGRCTVFSMQYSCEMLNTSNIGHAGQTSPFPKCMSAWSSSIYWKNPLFPLLSCSITCHRWGNHSNTFFSWDLCISYSQPFVNNHYTCVI